MYEWILAELRDEGLTDVTMEDVENILFHDETENYDEALVDIVVGLREEWMEGTY